MTSDFRIRKTLKAPAPVTMAKWEHLRAKSVKALRANWSVGAIARAYEVPPHVVRQWRDDAGIAPHTGPTRRTPAVGEELT